MHARFFVLLLVALLPLAGARGQTAATATAEVARCRERIDSVRRDVFGKYEDQLADLQAQLQKAADLEGALVVRAERQRLAKEQTLTEKQLLAEPKTLRTLQEQALGRFQELAASVVTETIPRLAEIKKALTIAGQLDDAVAVRTLITELQTDHVPLKRPSSGEFVSIDTLIAAYAADRARADEAYKDARIALRGTLVTYRLDPSDPRRATLYLGRSNGPGWVACVFDNSIRFREDKAFNTAALVVLNPAGQIAGRWSPGQNVELLGTCAGFEDVVRLVKCDLAR